MSVVADHPVARLLKAAPSALFLCLESFWLSQDEAREVEEWLQEHPDKIKFGEQSFTGEESAEQYEAKVECLFGFLPPNLFVLIYRASRRGYLKFGRFSLRPAAADSTEVTVFSFS